MNDEFEDTCASYITCPACGWVDYDSSSIDFGCAELAEVECGECSRMIKVERCIAIDYACSIEKR